MLNAEILRVANEALLDGLRNCDGMLAVPPHELNDAAKTSAKDRFLSREAYDFLEHNRLIKRIAGKKLWCLTEFGRDRALELKG